MKASASPLCSDCPPPDYPTDDTRCSECPRRKRCAAPHVVDHTGDCLPECWCNTTAPASEPAPKEQRMDEFDRQRFEHAPCYLCGYNGAGYYQPALHRCAAMYHGYELPPSREPAPAYAELIAELRAAIEPVRTDESQRDLRPVISKAVTLLIRAAQIEAQKDAEIHDLVASSVALARTAQALARTAQIDRQQKDARIAELERELSEQCRLHGIGSNREAKQLTEIRRLRAALEQIAAPNRKGYIWVASRIAREALAGSSGAGETASTQRPQGETTELGSNGKPSESPASKIGYMGNINGPGSDPDVP